MTYHLQSKENGTRNKEVYVSSKTKRRLFWIKQAWNTPWAIDEIADKLLNERIEELYPNIKTLEKRLGALEDQLVLELLSPIVDK